MPYKDKTRRNALLKAKRQAMTPEERQAFLAERKTYRLAHAEEIKAAQKKYYEEHREELLVNMSEKAKARRLANPEKARTKEAEQRAAIKARRLSDPEFNEKYLAQRREIRAKQRAKASLTFTRGKRRERLKKLGWTLERWEETTRAQNNACAICKQVLGLVADHEHTTPPKPRGALCNSCNSLIGFAKENPETCRAAAEYLEAWTV